MSTKCQAKNPATCRYHGENFIVDKVYKKFVIQKGWHGKVEQYQILVKSINQLLDDPNYVASYEKLLPEDVYGTLQNLAATEEFVADPSPRSFLYYFPTEDIISEVMYLKDDNKFVLPDTNLLTEGNKQRIANFMAAMGTPVSANPTYFSWNDSNMSDHIKHDCEIVNVSEINENASWREFDQTIDDEDDPFSDSADDFHYGVDAKAQCKCGRFKGMLRFEGSIN